MNSYVQGNLIAGEQVVYEAKISVFSLWPFIVLGALFILPGILVLLVLIVSLKIFNVIGFQVFSSFVIGGLFLGYAYLQYKFTELVVTSKRVIAKFGVVRRHTIELNINQIESIQVLQGVFGRMFNYGSLVITGTGATKEPIPGIDSPLAFRQAFAATHDSVGKEVPSGGPVSGGVPDAEKVCPQCAEHVKFAAKVCRFCGYSFT